MGRSTALTISLVFGSLYRGMSIGVPETKIPESRDESSRTNWLNRSGGGKRTNLQSLASKERREIEWKSFA